MSHTTGSLARALGARCEGSGDVAIDKVASLEHAGPGALAFALRHHREGLATTRASAVLGARVPEPESPQPKARADLNSNATKSRPSPVWLVHEDPRLAFARAAAWLAVPVRPAPAVHPRSWVDPTAVIDGATIDAFAVVEAGAQVGPGTWVRPHAYVGRGVHVGRDCTIEPSAVILEGTTLGDRVVVGPGAVLGGPGFGYVKAPDGPVPFPQHGRVELGHDVVIGANSCVDRASLDVTTVGAGTKTDNLVQIAHGVQVGEGVLLAAFAGLAGSSVVDDGAVLAGRAAVTEGTTVGKGAVLVGLASADRDVAPGMVVGGSPARRHTTWLREVAALRRLPALLRRLRDVEPGGPVDRTEVEALLPHREPFLLVDRVLEVEPGVKAVGEKVVRDDEFWVPGHFPGEPIMPGVLITEAIAQVAGIAHMAGLEPGERGHVYLVGVDKMRFRRMVRPGDVLHLTAEVTGKKRGLWFFAGSATTAEGEKVADGEFIAKIE